MASSILDCEVEACGAADKVRRSGVQLCLTGKRMPYGTAKWIDVNPAVQQRADRPKTDIERPNPMGYQYQSNPPQLLPTAVLDGKAPGLTYRIQGELVPVLHVWLDGSVPVIFEHHVVLWKDPGLNIGIHQMKGAFKRIIAGMPIFLTEARGPGEVAFSRDGAGHVFPIHLQPGTAVEVREHQYLAATGNLDYGFSRQQGIGNMLFGSTGFFVDRFAATQTEGVVWLHGYGNVFEKNLGDGEQIDIEPGGWIYRDETVQMEPMVYGLKTGIFGGSGNLIFNRFSGPGRVGIQSMYLHMPSGEDDQSNRNQTPGINLGSIFGN